MMIKRILSRSLPILFILAFFLSLPSPVFAGANNITIACDRWPSTCSLEKFTSDCIRLAGARDDEAKALSIWQYIQYLTVTGKSPKEPALRKNYILDPLKLLNVYGVHWCDGLSRIMTMCWRSQGCRAEKLYKFGHTLADCYWRDRDGVGRWHVFDVSQHWYVYDRSGGHIASADELALDYSLLTYPSRTPVPSWPSLMQPSFVHAGHLWSLPYRKMSFSLRPGERMVFLWGNEGKPYYDLHRGARRDLALTPYPRTYGNGRLSWNLDFADLSEAAVGVTMDGLEVVRQKERILLRPVQGSRVSSVIIPVSLPYIISDAWVVLSGRLGPGDHLRLLVSLDDGKTWHTCGPEKEIKGELAAQRVDFCPKFNPAAGEKPSLATPFGRYHYSLKLELTQGKDSSDCFLEQVALTTVFQHNVMALPMLWPGKNQVEVNGELEKNIHLKVSYRWAEGKRGKVRHQSVILDSLPAVYEVKTRGRQWSDCRCLALEIAALKMDKTGSRDFFDPDYGLRLPAGKRDVKLLPPARLVGRGKRPHLRTVDFYLERLEKLLDAAVVHQKDDRFLKKQAGAIGGSILMLGALGDPRSAPLLTRVIREDRTHPCANKIKACQALYRSVGRQAVPVMLDVLRHASAITWYDTGHRWPADTMWLHTAAMAVAVLADVGNFPERETAAGLVEEILRGKKSQYQPARLWRGREICWGLIKNLGKLGSGKNLPLLLHYLEDDGDAGSQAALALGDIGAGKAVPGLVKRLQHFDYPPVGLNSIRALGKCSTAAAGHYLYPFLEHWDEDFRGLSSKVLGEIDDRQAIPYLGKLLADESFPWVREAADESLRLLAGQ